VRCSVSLTAAPCPGEGPGSPGPGEVERLAGQGQTVLAGARVEAQPLPHRRALVRVEMDAVTGLDQRVDPPGGKLHHQPAADQHREDLALVAQGAAAEAAAAAWRSHARGADELLDQVLVPLVRPAGLGVLSQHGPSLGMRSDNGAGATVGVVANSPLDRSFAQECDAADPLAAFCDRFVRDDPSLIYLDGNSLGMLPLATAERISKVVRDGWGRGLIRSWGHWMALPRQVGDLLGHHLLGAAPGQVLVCDSTTVNLYKLARAALDAQPGRCIIVTDDDNFPTDRYVLAGVAAERGADLRLIHTDMDTGVTASAVRDAVDGATALVSLS